MAPPQYLAVFFAGAFLITLITAVFYRYTVRDRLLNDTDEPQSLDELLRVEMTDQRSALHQLNLALAHHTEQLQAQVSPGEALQPLAEMLRSQNNVVMSINALLDEHSSRLTRLDDRMLQQELAQRESAQQLMERFASMDERFTRQETAIHQSAQNMASFAKDILPRWIDVQQQETKGLNTRFDQLEARVPALDHDRLQGLIQAQADLLTTISARLDEWAATRQQAGDPAAAQARILAELDRELATHAQSIQNLDSKVSEHTTMLITAASERREQAGILERILYELRQIGPTLKETVVPKTKHPQDRLIDIYGIGPAYSRRLHEKGIYTFSQLAALTPDDVLKALDLPAWRAKTVKVENWIEQAKQFMSQDEKGDA